MLGLTLDESGRLAAVVWPCSRDVPIGLSAFQSTDRDFIATSNPTYRDEIFGASIHLSTHDGGDRPWLVPILDPPHGWEVDFDNVQDRPVRRNMRWQVGGEAVDNTWVKYRLPDARQPDPDPRMARRHRRLRSRHGDSRGIRTIRQGELLTVQGQFHREFLDWSTAMAPVDTSDRPGEWPQACASGSTAKHMS